MRREVLPPHLGSKPGLPHWGRSTLLGAVLLSSSWMQPTPAGQNPALQDASPQAGFYESTRPYLEMPLEQLVPFIPELSTIHTASGQQLLAPVLERTGERVDEFLRDIVNLAAREEVTQEKLGNNDAVQTSQQWEYNYLIIIHRNEKPARLEEYRTDVAGKPVSQGGATKGFSVTSGFALKCIYLSTAHQQESTFLYLGDAKVGERNTYVVAFAQRPDRASMAEFIHGPWGSRFVFVQGIAWIDQDTFQILRLRTDLLGPPVDLRLTRQTTEVTFAETKLPDIDAPLWLPSRVNVYAMFDSQAFRNEHRYENFERYRVSVNIITP